jgi:hypothetical protein
MLVGASMRSWLFEKFASEFAVAADEMNEPYRFDFLSCRRDVFALKALEVDASWGPFAVARAYELHSFKQIPAGHRGPREV